MNRGVVKVATYCLLGTLTIGSAGIVSHAETPMAGVTVAIDEAVQSNVIPNVTVNQAPVVNSEYDNLAIAQVNSYVNIRDAASEEGYIIGKIYNNSAGRILGEENGWYKVESGTVVGYVKGEFFATGEEAAELAKEVGTQYAEVNTTTLYVRNEPSTESSVVALLGDSEKLQVLEEVDGWLKVTIDGIEGYISKDFVTTTTKFTEAESKEEEETRIRKEEEARKAAEEAERQRIAAEEAARVAAEQVQETEAVVETETPETEAPETQAPETQAPETQAPETQAPQTPQASSTGSRGQDIANFATQYVGGRYVWGGTNLATGVDCSGFTLSVLKNFGISIPRVAADQANAGTAVSIDNIQPGDLLFYSSSGYIDHVAIYIGNGQIVHASSSKTGIKYSNYNYRQPVKAVRYW
ncbi:MAG TPA: C40 family peptidase [Candidatus Merdenecus merdavium]|nr:C40 family peptidase [Candidatus Merdenecus merdavium]